MSRAYRLSLSESLRHHTVVGDGIDTRLDILPILPKEQMGEIIADELALRGFEKRDDGKWESQEEDGVTIVVDAQENVIELRLRKEINLELTKKGSQVIDEDYKEQGEKSLKTRLKNELQREAEQKEQALQQEITDTLAKKLHDLQKDFDEISNRVVGNALKKRAAQLGEIENIEEDQQSGSLTIRVKV